MLFWKETPITGNIEYIQEQIGSNKSKLFHVLKILKEKWKQKVEKSLNELKKAEILKQYLTDKYPDETVTKDDSPAKFITFQKLNKNLCTGL